VRIGLYSDALPHLDRPALFAFCAERGITDVELGVGTWGPDPRPHLDLARLLRDASARDALAGELRDHGLGLSCVNAAGNVLHPDPAQRADAQGRLRGAVELAHLLGVDTVVTMSGCPGGRTGGPLGVFAVWSTCADDEALWEWQFANEVAPFWGEVSRWMDEVAPGVTICLELHPGVAVFNAAGFLRLADVTGRNIGVNLDPSHFWWQGIDPVRVVEAVGDRIGYAHGKDTLIHADRIALHGVLDYRFPVDPDEAAWHFAAVGDGHTDADWARLLAAMRSAGYDGVVSIEHEDPRLSAEAGVTRSAEGLRRALELLA
jgi:sugar phosphate isomerase/epimerase